MVVDMDQQTHQQFFFFFFFFFFGGAFASTDVCSLPARNCWIHSRIVRIGLSFFLFDCNNLHRKGGRINLDERRRTDKEPSFIFYDDCCLGLWLVVVGDRFFTTVSWWWNSKTFPTLMSSRGLFDVYYKQESSPRLFSFSLFLLLVVTGLKLFLLLLFRILAFVLEPAIVV